MPTIMLLFKKFASLDTVHHATWSDSHTICVEVRTSSMSRVLNGCHSVQLRECALLFKVRLAYETKKHHSSILW
jgi:hypothetical protein